MKIWDLWIGGRREGFAFKDQVLGPNHAMRIKDQTSITKVLATQIIRIVGNNGFFRGLLSYHFHDPDYLLYSFGNLGHSPSSASILPLFRDALHMDCSIRVRSIYMWELLIWFLLSPEGFQQYALEVEIEQIRIFYFLQRRSGQTGNKDGNG